MTFEQLKKMQKKSIIKQGINCDGINCRECPVFIPNKNTNETNCTETYKEKLVEYQKIKKLKEILS